MAELQQTINTAFERCDFLRFRVFLGTAETLVRWGGKTNHQSIACSLSNIPIKNY